MSPCGGRSELAPLKALSEFVVRAFCHLSSWGLDFDAPNVERALTVKGFLHRYFLHL